MSTPLAAMMARYMRPGRVEWVGLRPERRGAMAAVETVEVLETGLAGDHGRRGKRAVTLLQEEHLPAVAALSGHRLIRPEVLRRNLVVSGLNLIAFRGKALRVGEAILELTVPAHPCSRMEEALGEGGYTAMRGHGGFCAAVIQPGRVSLGDAVTPA